MVWVGRAVDTMVMHLIEGAGPEQREQKLHFPEINQPNIGKNCPFLQFLQETAEEKR